MVTTINNMEARLQYIKNQVFDDIIQLLSELKRVEMYEIKEFLPEEFRGKVDHFLELIEGVVESEDNKNVKGREEVYNKFITQVKDNYRLLFDRFMFLKKLSNKYHKMMRELEIMLKEIEEKQSAAHNSPQDLKNTLIKQEEEQEEVDLTDMKEYDLTGTGEPVYETPIMTLQLYCRITANEFSQDQVEYIIKKSLHL